MKLMQLSVAWMLLCFHIQKATCANILIVWPWYLQSHFKSFQQLFENLVNRKHNVTLISGYPLKDSLQSEYIFVNVSSQFPKSKMSDVIKKVKQITLLEYSKIYIDISTNYVDRILRLPEVQEIIQSDSHYDLVIGELLLQDAFFAFGSKFNAPTIALSPMKMVPVYNWWLCDPHPPSFVMNQFLRMPGKMTLISRITNTVYNFILVTMFELIALPRYQSMIEEYFHFDEENVPLIKDIIKNISVIFTVAHYSLGYIKPELPNIVNVGGLHFTPLKTLPSNIQRFMDEAESGVIYLSLGSTVEPTAFDDLGNTFVEILGRLPERVIMKWNPKLLTKVPENVMVQEWIPQPEVLNHPKCVLFITHGGILSCLETLNASVPVVGIPIFSDQHYNLAVMEYYEMGTMIQLDEVPAKLADNVDEVLNNPKYKNNIKKRSTLFRDRLVEPMDEAIYWIDHVLKHKDTVHLRSAELQLTWYERFSLDVLFILTVMTLSAIYLTKCCLIWLVRKLIFYVIVKYPDRICDLNKDDDHTKFD